MRGAKNFKNVFILAQNIELSLVNRILHVSFRAKLNDVFYRILTRKSPIYWIFVAHFFFVQKFRADPLQFQKRSESSTVLTVKQLKLQLICQTWMIVNDLSWIIRVKPQKSLLNKLLNCLKCLNLLFLHLESGLTEWGLKEKSYRCTWGYSFYGCFKIALCWWLLSLSGLGKW